MEGKINFQEAMKIKMSTIAPSYQDFLELGNVYCKSLVKDIEKVVQVLHSLDKDVWILTGNFQPAVGMVAAVLGIPNEKIICNEIYFDSDGKYKGFNVNHPLSSNGGKAIMIKRHIKKHKIVFVGDGYTDLEVKKEVDLFIGYGGVEARDHVEKNSKFYINCKSMSPLLELILSKEEKESVESGMFKKTARKGFKTCSAKSCCFSGMKLLVC